MNMRYLVVPHTLRQLRIRRSMLAETRRLLAGPGEDGFEAVVFWIGMVVSAEVAYVDEVYFPRQVAYSTPDGLAVEVPVEEWTDLVLRLPVGRFILAKLHTHGEHAYHSDQDVANPYLCHEGAVAITVPTFACAPFDTFAGWSVNVFRDQRWRALNIDEAQHTLVVEDHA
jgi:hypothetical protein